MPDVLSRFRNVQQWQKGGKRAPHKPLMLLIALGRYQNGIKEFSYKEVEQQLTHLLVEYGPQRAKYKPEEPFWRLGSNKKEALFVFNNHERVRVHKDGGTNKSDLINNNVTAAFDTEIQQAFDKTPELITDVVLDLIYAHFQPSYVEDLLDEIGIIVESIGNSKRRKRDPDFRKKIITAYESRCAICGFHLMFNQQPIGLEAAHIKWHNAGGPDTEDNGLALCTMHHKLFDYGVFLIEPATYKIKVAREASCFNSAEDYVLGFHNEKIRMPISVDSYPKEDFLLWHEREKFKGTPRL